MNNYRHKIIFLIILILSCRSPASAQNLLIDGYVRDASTRDPIPGANVIVKQNGAGTATKDNGYYSLNLPAGSYILVVSSIGYQDLEQKVNVAKNRQINFELTETVTELDEIVVSDQADQNIRSLDPGKTSLKIENIKAIPPLFGEIDVVKSLIMLPGVSTVGEGSAGFNVRGGSVDQNLVLFDGIPLFNSSHLFGMFSVFNPDVISNIDLYKGHVPAKFGGRISSVLSVEQKQPDLQSFSFDGGLGIISSRLTTEMPLIKNKTSILLSGRATYSDWLLKQVPDEDIKNSAANFYDLNGKIIHFFNDKNVLSFSSYLGKDSFRFASDTTYGWQNQLFGLKYNSEFSPNWLLNLNFSNSRYRYFVSGTQPLSEFRLESKIDYLESKAEIEWKPGENKRLNFGTNLINYKLQPGTLTPTAVTSAINPLQLAAEKAWEGGLFFDFRINLTNRITLSSGLRYSFFEQYGPGKVFLFNGARQPDQVSDTLVFSSGESISNYSGWEPRMALRILINDFSSMKFSYNRMRQYIHLISNTTSITPTDIWKISDYHLKPLTGNQWSAGYYHNLDQNRIETSLEFYFKRMNNLVEYKDGAQLLLNEMLSTELINGEGRAYGLELMIRKKSGRWNGWLSYTYSRSFRRVRGNYEDEVINAGNWFPANFDKPHDLTLVSNHLLHPKWNFSFNYTYSTGRPATLPQSQFVIGEVIVPFYPERNADRVPDYHRLDLSITFNPNAGKKSNWTDSWTFAIYNLYGRKNPYSVFVRQEYSRIPPQAFKLSVLGAILPSLTYNFSFR